MDKDTELQQIKDFSKITIKSICDEIGIDTSTLWSGRLSASKVSLVKQLIIEKVNKIFE